MIKYIINILIFIIVARAILSFIIPMMGSRPHPTIVSINNLIFQITEPILGPIRRVLPTFGAFDFSPLVVIIVLSVIRAQLP